MPDADETDAPPAAPGPTSIEPAAPEDFGRLQVWWGDGKGKTTAALGMAIRAAGHGFRVHVLQFMKGGADSVEDVRGEYNAMAALPGITFEHAGHYGWHGRRDGTAEESHAERAASGVERAKTICSGAAAKDLRAPIDANSPPENGVHMLVLDELCYAANRGLVDESTVVELVEDSPDGLELVLTGGHERPTYVTERAALVTEVRKERHPFEEGVPARRGTEF